jgi:hypothetical protein
VFGVPRIFLRTKPGPWQKIPGCAWIAPARPVATQCVRKFKHDDKCRNGLYSSTNESERPNWVLSWNRDCWNAAFGPLSSIVEKHCVDDHLILKDPMSHLNMCE